MGLARVSKNKTALADKNGVNLTVTKVTNKYKPKYDRLDCLSNRYDELDKLANLYNKTKDNKYKDEWYKRVKEMVKHLKV